MGKLNQFCNIGAEDITTAARDFGTPFYLYDEKHIIENCKKALAMPNAHGLTVRYAMKANSNLSLLKLISSQGLNIDASSMNEVRRAGIAGIPYKNIMLTTQEVPLNKELDELKKMIKGGLKYNVCSMQQLFNIGEFAAKENVKLAIRFHPGIGSGESATRNTGDKYSCFGVHLSDIEKALSYAKDRGIIFNLVHSHIGSGGDPQIWQDNIDLELGIIDKYFPHAETANFGGGLKVARMPDEKAADIEALGLYAKEKMEDFYKKTGRKLKMEFEPGNFIIANTGYIVCTIIDKKTTGEDGINFLVLDGGMELNTRPLLYGAGHPFYIISKNGELLSKEDDFLSPNVHQPHYEAVPVGRCCESGDMQSLDKNGLCIPRRMAEPEIGDYFIIGGAGAYCSSMSPMNYNSHVQAPEILFTSQGELKVIRKEQTLEQMLTNEVIK